MPYWKHLRACMPAKSLEAFSTYRGYLESLHYLELRQPSWQDQANSPVHAFEMAHSLRILNINSGLGHHICLPDGGKGLTNLTIYGGSVKNMCILLGNTPNIETLGLYIQMSRPFERLNSPIMMPKVTSLVISEWDGAAPSSIAHLFESLELPALSNLCFNLDNEESDSTVFVFPEILPHHHCRGITALTVTAPGSKVGKVGLIGILTHIKNLEDLTISAQIIDEDLFSALTRSNNNDDDILPQLLTFDLRNSESIPDHKIFLQMVESRMQDQTEDDKREEGVIGLRKIEEVYLNEPLTFDDPSLASRWQALQSNGLVVYYGD
ncbi:hypothetical protein EV421DRAFT_1905188 [Armillaria borealis]|uniref:Uncharacterized protein n=1 Tax=Armillaria borealis TaxID=47425 RepID=A0AA39MPB9_9AGAR|nr:hypothetical protein EV421DRAFT_1905188 [Armillaria borealis]